MGATRAEIRTAFRRYFDDATNVEIDEFVGQALLELGQSHPAVYFEDTYNVTAGDNEIDLDDSITSIYRIEYQVSATDRRVLNLMLKDDLEQEFPSWRQETADIPTRAVIEDARIVVVPTPDDTTSGTYPRYLVCGIEVPAALSDSQNLPDNFPHMYVVLWRALRLFAIAKQRFNMVEQFRLEQIVADRQLDAFLSRRGHDLFPRFEAPMQRRRRRP